MYAEPTWILTDESSFSRRPKPFTYSSPCSTKLRFLKDASPVDYQYEQAFLINLRAGCAPLMGSRAGAGNKAGRDCLHSSKADPLEAEGRGEEKRREAKGRDEKDNQSSQYGDKIRSQD